MYTVRAAAQYLGIAVGTFRRYVLPRLAPDRLGRRYLITRGMLDAFLTALGGDGRVPVAARLRRTLYPVKGGTA